MYYNISNIVNKNYNQIIKKKKEKSNKILNINSLKKN